jgi:hypothetical protein
MHGLLVLSIYEREREGGRGVEDDAQVDVLTKINE